MPFWGHFGKHAIRQVKTVLPDHNLGKLHTKSSQKPPLLIAINPKIKKIRKESVPLKIQPPQLNFNASNPRPIWITKGSPCGSKDVSEG